MGKLFEKNLIIILLTIISFFLFSISDSLKKSAKYDSDLIACAKMKAYNNDKDLSQLFKEQASTITGIEMRFITEYCKKLTQQNIF